MITLIAAMDQNNVIGKDGEIPWYISGDFKRFKKLTTGHTVVMGRKTFDSIGRILPDRHNIVLTSQTDYQESVGISKDNNQFHICHSTEGLKDYLNFVDTPDYPEIFIIGGTSLYEFGIPFADKLELTFVDGKYDGDAFFPPFFKIGDVITFDEHNSFTRTNYMYPSRQGDDPIYSFQTFERIRSEGNFKEN